MTVGKKALEVRPLFSGGTADAFVSIDIGKRPVVL
jgi:hypothetical protein